MNDDGYNYYNSFVSLSVKQNLLLWQTTKSLLEIDQNIRKVLADEKSDPTISGQSGKKPNFISWLKKFFTK